MRGLLCLCHFRVSLSLVGTRSTTRKVVAKVVSLFVGMLAHPQAGHGYPVQGVHVVIGRTPLRRLRLLSSGGRRWRRRRRCCRPSTGLRYIQVGSWLAQVDVSWELGHLALGFQKSRLKIDNILAQLIVLCLQRLESLRHSIKLLHLLLQFANVTFFSLAECSLFPSQQNPRRMVNPNIPVRHDFEQRAWRSTTVACHTSSDSPGPWAPAGGVSVAGR